MSKFEWILVVVAIAGALTVSVLDDQQKVVIHGVWAQGHDPGTDTDGDGRGDFLVEKVFVEGKEYPREWYLEHVNHLRVVDIVSVAPSHMRLGK